MTLTKLNYVKEAEDVVLSLKKKRKKAGAEIVEEYILTTSKIRNLFSMIMEIYNMALHISKEKLTEDCLERIQYLKMRFAYEAGKEDLKEGSVKDLIKKAEIFEQIDKIGDSKEKCIIFCRYMEAIVAYHKYYGGKDK